MRAKSARVTKARKAMLMEDAKASVNMLSCDSLILFVIGIAEDDDDIRRYAIICSKQATNKFCPCQSQGYTLVSLISWHWCKIVLLLQVSSSETIVLTGTLRRFIICIAWQFSFSYKTCIVFSTSLDLTLIDKFIY